MMQSPHPRRKKMGAMALAIVASSVGTIVFAQSPASAVPATSDPNYTVSQLASGLSSPANGLLFRAATNDLLVSEFGADRITKIGASTGTKSSFASLVSPNELAIASNGNVYAKSHPSGPIFRFSSSGAPLSPSSFASPCTGQFGETSGLAFDATNNFYVGCADAGTIYKFAAGTITSPSLFAQGLPDVEALRFDGTGRLFTTDFPGGRVFEVKPGGVQLSDHTLWASGLNCPLNVAFDPVSHNVFATGTGRIVRMSAPGIVSTFATGFTTTPCAGTYALDFDPAGNLYVDDLTAGAVWKFRRGTFTCDGQPATIVGTEGSDNGSDSSHPNISGTPGRDVIVGLGGSDWIKGFGGDDLICGDDGQDAIFGGDGNDVIFGGRNKDRILGGEGDDEIHGGTSNDNVYGENGHDNLFGDFGDDLIDGGPQTDTCDGGPGADTIRSCP
jgi:Ca2+-binding RTX toxin-like protein